MPTTYVLDTNILLSDGAVLRKLNNVSIIIPFVVLEELDKHKYDPGETGANARSTSRDLDSIIELGNFRDGIETPWDNTIYIIHNASIEDLIPDDQIIAIAEATTKQLPKGHEAILLSNDINVRIKAATRGIKARKHDRHKLSIDADGVFGKINAMDVPEEMVNGIYAKGRLNYDGSYGELMPNEYALLRSDINPSKSAIVRYNATMREIERVIDIKGVFGISPKNIEQRAAIDAIMNPDIMLTTLSGIAGCGKTLIAVACALELVLQKKIYDKIIIIKPPVPMGPDIGYLSGDLHEKMSAWSGSVQDAFEVLLSNNARVNLNMLIESGTIQIVPPTYCRGRSYQKSVILVDETQNLDANSIKALVSRAAESSKIILTGDITQGDIRGFSAVSNGLTHIIERMKHTNITAHITMITSLRSNLAALAAELL